MVGEIYKQAEVFFNSKFRHDLRTFSTVKEYEEDYTIVMNLKVQNFRLLFQLYCLFQGALGALFVGCHLTRRLTRGCSKGPIQCTQFNVPKLHRLKRQLHGDRSVSTLRMI